MESERVNVQQFIYSKLSIPDAIISEREVARKFELKRNIVREIFLAMEGQGVLERMPQVGYRCVNYRATDLLGVRTIRYAVEHEALRCAMEKLTDEDLKALEKTLIDMRKYLDNADLHNFAESDMLFHQTLINASRDKFIINIFSFMTSTVFQLKNTVDVTLVEETYKHHIEMFAALQQRDFPAASTVLHKHIGRFTSFHLQEDNKD